MTITLNVENLNQCFNNYMYCISVYFLSTTYSISIYLQPSIALLLVVGSECL